MIDHYDWAGGREAMLRLGSANQPVVMVALPPFEEANRTRTFAVTLMRRLSERAIASVLPDLPGTGESLVATEAATLERWRSAFAAAALATAAHYSIAIRAGALIDIDADVARWHLSPQSGALLVRELDRMRMLSGPGGDGEVVEVAGNRVAPRLLDELRVAEPATARVVRLENDRQHADRVFPAGPLWRRTEPDNDPVLASALADDIAAWIDACAT